MKLLYILLLIALVFSSHYAEAIDYYDVNKKKDISSLYGGVKIQWGHVNEKGDSNTSNTTIVSVPDLHLLYIKNFGKDLSVGADFGLEMPYQSIYTTATIIPNDGHGKTIANIHNKGAYAFIKSKNMGLLEIGIADSVDTVMKVGSSNIAVAAGGISGNWSNYVSIQKHSQAVDKPSFWVKPSLYNHHYSLLSPVINYYSPKVKNFNIGITYIPGESNLGYRNMVVTGIKYHNKIGKLKYAVAVVNEVASAVHNEKTNLNSLQSWNAGLSINYKGFQYVISYGYLGNIEKPTGIISNISDPDLKTQYFDTGLSYNFKKFKGSITYFNSKSGQDNKLTAYSTGIEYSIFKNTSLYAEITQFDTKTPNNTNNDNDGYVVISGLKLWF